MMMGEGGGFMLPLVLHRANLTPEQHDKVRKILESDRQDLQKLFSALGKANDELSKRLFAPGDVALGDLKPQLDEIAGLRRQLMEQGIKTALAIRKVLTPEQLAKVAELKQRMDKLHAEMRELMGGTDSISQCLPLTELWLPQPGESRCSALARLLPFVPSSFHPLSRSVSVLSKSVSRSLPPPRDAR